MRPPSRQWIRRASAGIALAGLLVAAGCAAPLLRYQYKPRLTAPGSDLRAALSIASGFQAVDGNSVTLLENGDEAFPAMLEAIRNAKVSIHLENNIFRDSQIGREIVSALAERARSGVRVRLLIDAFGASLGGTNLQILKKSGAQLVTFRPLRLKNLRKVHLRTHRKLLIVDGTIGFTGGICIDDPWLGDADRPERWRDTQVRIEGPAVRQMQVAFARAWVEATGELLSARSLFHSPPSGDLTCQVIDSIPGAALNPARLAFLIAVSAARSKVDVTNAYFVPDHTTREALRDAARRGVRVRLILASRNTDLKPIRYAGRIYYKDLLEEGVEIYEYLPARLHAKTAVVDGYLSSVGSVNLDRRSFAFNYEANLVVLDEGFASQLTEMFERDLALSERITLEAWKKRPFGEKVLERLYGIFRWQY